MWVMTRKLFEGLQIVDNAPTRSISLRLDSSHGKHADLVDPILMH